ncbi:MAG: hypothetical protein IT367_16425 [Candidatus Hydrogenedentes bacterium]|nr:hypothetical protein [Candidatus Hydrogenedentota bacterium]
MRAAISALFCTAIFSITAVADFEGKIVAVETATSLTVSHDGRTSTVFVNGVIANRSISKAARYAAKEKLVNQKVKVVETFRTSSGRIYADVFLENGNAVRDELISVGVATDGTQAPAIGKPTSSNRDDPPQSRLQDKTTKDSWVGGDNIFSTSDRRIQFYVPRSWHAKEWADSGIDCVMLPDAFTDLTLSTHYIAVTVIDSGAVFENYNEWEAEVGKICHRFLPGATLTTTRVKLPENPDLFTDVDASGLNRQFMRARFKYEVAFKREIGLIAIYNQKHEKETLISLELLARTLDVQAPKIDPIDYAKLDNIRLKVTDLLKSLQEAAGSKGHTISSHRIDDVAAYSEGGASLRIRVTLTDPNAKSYVREAVRVLEDIAQTGDSDAQLASGIAPKDLDGFAFLISAILAISQTTVTNQDIAAGVLDLDFRAVSGAKLLRLTAQIEPLSHLFSQNDMQGLAKVLELTTF